jgi:hypothetical protein
MSIQTSAETEVIASQLAALRGQTIDQVVSAALRSELIRERQAHVTTPVILSATQRAKVERIMELVRAAGRAGDNANTDPTAFLYDDQGMPA